MKILVRGTNWIGDSVMSVPALRRLRKSCPDAHITLAAPGWCQGIFGDAEFLDDFMVLEGSGHSISSVCSQAARARKESFDAAILFTNSFGSALAARLSGIARRYGYAAEGRGFLLSAKFEKPEWKSERHESEFYLNLVNLALEELGCTPDRSEPDPSIAVSRAKRDLTRDLLESKGIGKRAAYAVLGPGSTNSRAKRWSAAGFAETADLLRRKEGLMIVLLGSQEERDVANEVKKAAAEAVVDLTGETSLDEAVAVLAEASLVVSNDMGLAHVAAAAGTPTVVIFGPTNPLTTSPLGAAIVREPVECSPCMLRDCPIDHRCMTRISPERVAKEAARLLAAQ